jgi:hypothetical protein
MHLRLTLASSKTDRRVIKAEDDLLNANLIEVGDIGAIFSPYTKCFLRIFWAGKLNNPS